MKYPKITIGITSYNAEATIVRAINSALQQNYANFEILIVDDGSSDNSITIIEKYIQENENIRLIQHRENKGTPVTRNTIIKNAEGKYIAFFDDDDESFPQRLIKQYERLSEFEKKYPNTPVLCFCHKKEFNTLKTVLVHGIGHKEPEPYGKIAADRLLYNPSNKSNYSWGCVSTGALMASYKIFTNFLYDTQFRRSQDVEMATRLVLQGGYLISVDEVLLNQYETITSDKTGYVTTYIKIKIFKKRINLIKIKAEKILYYRLKLRVKHKKYLQSKKIYYGVILHTFAMSLQKTSGSKMRFICYILGCLIAPRYTIPIMINVTKNKIFIWYTRK